MDIVGRGFSISKLCHTNHDSSTKVSIQFIISQHIFSPNKLSNKNSLIDIPYLLLLQGKDETIEHIFGKRFPILYYSDFPVNGTECFRRENSSISTNNDYSIMIDD